MKPNFNEVTIYINLKIPKSKILIKNIINYYIKKELIMRYKRNENEQKLCLRFHNDTGRLLNFSVLSAFSVLSLPFLSPNSP